MKVRRRVSAVAAVVLVASLAACAPTLPESVVPGSALTVEWTGEFTSANAAASPTAGNVDIAETIRGDFGDLIDGDFVPDEGFGAVTIVSDDPFTVRYDLAEPSWSDGIPVDAADLLLGWAGLSGFVDLGTVPSLDEFARAIQMTFPHPVLDWQQAVRAPVPAHVVGRLAFGLDDDMEAKQAVIAAIQEQDSAALGAIATVWEEGFALSDQAEPAADLLISSGPFLVGGIERSAAGQSVTLVPNPSYRGLVTPQVARIDLVPPAEDPVAAVGAEVDAVQVAPVASNRAPIIELERKDFTVDTTHDGTVWAVLLNPVGVFTEQRARTAFIHAVPASALVERGAGDWATAYSGTTSMVSAPGSRAYDIVSADSGFTEALGQGGNDPALEREAAGFAAGVPVCVLYDRRSEFAVGAFGALQDAASEAGWVAVDCGSDDFDGALAQRGWNAVIARVPIPHTPEQIATQWGSEGDASITRHADAERDALIAQLAQTADIYEAREIRALIEATIVRAAVALPIAANPRVTISDRDVTGVAARNGAVAPLTFGAVQWAALP